MLFLVHQLDLFLIKYNQIVDYSTERNGNQNWVKLPKEHSKIRSWNSNVICCLSGGHSHLLLQLTSCAALRALAQQDKFMTSIVRIHILFFHVTVFKLTAYIHLKSIKYAVNKISFKEINTLNYYFERRCI